MPVLIRELVDPLILTSNVDVKKTVGLSVESILSVNDGITDRYIIKTITDLLDLQQIIRQPTYVLLITDELTLSHSINYTSAVLRPINDFLFLIQAIGSNIHFRSVESVLSLQQTIEEVIPDYLSVGHNLSECWWTQEELINLTVDQLAELCPDRGLRDTVEVRRSVTNLSVIDYLQLTQSAVKSISLSVSHHISLLDVVTTLAFYESVVSALALTQTIVYYQSKLLVSTLVLAQTISHVTVFNRNVSSTLVLDSVVTLLDGDRFTTSSQFVLPILTDTHSIVLTYPFQNPVLSVTLRAPEFNNQEQLEFHRINRRTRGGDLTIHRQAYWPSAERLIMKFTNLTHAAADSLLDFFNKTIGKEVGLLDHENRYWKGILLTPSALVKADTGRECQYSASLEFEGEIAGSHQLSVDMAGIGLVTADL